MAHEWQLRNEPIDDEEAISAACREQWEAFAIYEGEIWFKRLINVERGDRATDAPE